MTSHGLLNRRSLRLRSGWALVALVVLISVALIALVGISSSVVQGLRLGQVRVNATRALYLAHAGVMDALAGYLSATGSNWFELNCFGNDPACDNVPNLNLDSGEVFIRSPSNPQRDFLLVDMSTVGSDPVITRRSSQSTFDTWELKRIVSNKTLTIDALEVRWTDAVPSETVQRVCVNANWNGASCFTVSPPATSGSRIDISPNFTLSNNTTINNNHILFNARLDTRSPLTVALTFYLTDSGSCTSTDPALDVNDLAGLKRAQLVEECRRTAFWVRTDPASDWGVFTVRAAGEVRASPFTAQRALRAEFRAMSSDITASPSSRIIAWVEE